MLRVATLVSLGILASLSAATAQACSGCGCRGGPGYRGPNGQCVGWDAFSRTCGIPPTTHCKAEHVNARPGEEKAAPKPETKPERQPSAPRRQPPLSTPNTQTLPNPF